MTNRDGAPAHLNAHDRLPNLVIAGVAKAGTTSLFRYLAQHPEVCASDLKELRYFSALRYGERPAPLTTYARHFRQCGDTRFAMEATPGYFPGGRKVAEAMRDVLPDPHVIVTLRDPVQRCWSWFRFVRSTARIPKDMSFPEYLDHCERLHRDDVDQRREHQAFWGLGAGCYARWIDSWIDVFDERLRIEFFEHTISDPHAVTAGLCDWLGIDRAPAATFHYGIENKTVMYKHKNLQQVALSLNRRGERLFSRFDRVKRTLRGAYYLVNEERSADRLDDASKRRLVEFYGPGNERLARSLKAAGYQRLPDWVDPGGAPRGL